MYDPLKHYIAEGLVVLYSYPHPTDYGRKRGLFHKTSGIEMEIAQPMGAMGGYELRVKHKNVRFVYDVADEFWDDYTIACDSKDDAIARGQAWTDEVRATANSINLKELA